MLRVVDFGDAPVSPPTRSTHAAIEALVGEVLDAGALPIILGGDHSIAEPDIRASPRRGPGRPIHFDTHTDTGRRSSARALARHDHVPAGRAGARRPVRYVQIGLRGYWPGEKEFGWQHERGITSLFMHDIRDRGIREVVERTLSSAPARCS